MLLSEENCLQQFSVTASKKRVGLPLCFMIPGQLDPGQQRGDVGILFLHLHSVAVAIALHGGDLAMIIPFPVATAKQLILIYSK